jgi:hypothetical protein
MRHCSKPAPLGGRGRDGDYSPPPHTPRALLTHRAPTLDGDEEPFLRPRSPAPPSHSDEPHQKEKETVPKNTLYILSPGVTFQQPQWPPFHVAFFCISIPGPAKAGPSFS